MKLEDAIKQKTFESPQHKAVLDLLYTASWLRLRINQELKRHDLTSEQFNVLRILRGQKGKPISLKELTCRMLDKNSNTSRIVTRLLRKGWVARQECEHDRRAVDITLTPKGAELLETVDRAHFFARIGFKLDNSTCAQINELMEEIRRGVDAETNAC